MSQINYHNVEVCQQEMIVLENVNLKIQEGEFVYLIGKVGSGKSSLLKTMYGELDVHSGSAEVLGYDMAHIRRKQIPALRKRIGIVFQDFQLLTDRNVRDNLDFVLKATGWSDKRKRQFRIEEVLEQDFSLSVMLCLPSAFAGSFDISELRRIFDNLISNIQKYADPAQPVILDLTKTDTGITISQRNAIRKAQTVTESHQMGLYSMRRIAQHYGGAAEASGIDGQFVLTVTLCEF